MPERKFVLSVRLLLDLCRFVFVQMALAVAAHHNIGRVRFLLICDCAVVLVHLFLFVVLQ